MPRQPKRFVFVRPEEPATPPRKKNIIVVLRPNDSPELEMPPKDQLIDTCCDITVVNFYDFLPMILGEVHNTEILLADAILPRNQGDPRSVWNFQKFLIELAREKGLKGVGLITDKTQVFPPMSEDVGSLSVVVSLDCREGKIRDWHKLYGLVTARITARESGPAPKAKKPRKKQSKKQREICAPKLKAKTKAKKQKAKKPKGKEKE